MAYHVIVKWDILELDLEFIQLNDPCNNYWDESFECCICIIYITGITIPIS